VFDEEPGLNWLFASGVVAALACFSAYSNGPAVVLFTAPALLKLLTQPNCQKRLTRARPFIFGMASVIFAVGAWLLAYGDLKGYYIYHFYFNQAVYGKGFSLIAAIFDNFTFSFDSVGIVQSLALALFLCSIYIITLLPRTSDSTKGTVLRALALSVTACGVLFTNPTGQAANPSFVSVSFALFSLASASLLEGHLLAQYMRGTLNAALLCGAALTVTSRVSEYAKSYLNVPRREMSAYVEVPHPRNDAMYGFIRRITKMEGDLLALNYNAGIYYKSDRIPASGNVFYLPWQADYNRHPKYGYKLDICEDIKSNKPAVIWFFNWLVGDNGSSIDDYEPCVLTRIVENYTPLTFGSPWHVRNDLYASTVANLPTGADATDLSYGPVMPKVLRLGLRLSSFAPIRFMMSPTHLERKVLLRRVGVLIGTHSNQDMGEAELYLEGPNGTSFSQGFALSALADNSYHFFEANPGLYTQGGIRSVVGGGISVWESRWELGWKHSYTCMIYEYTDGARRYTPECPIK
jgi:hypothetical protein